MRTILESTLLNSMYELPSLENVSKVGITAGASAPERLVEGVLDWLKEHAQVMEVIEMVGRKERISFKPAALAE